MEFQSRSCLTKGFNFLLRSSEAFVSTLLQPGPILLGESICSSEDNQRFPFRILLPPSSPSGKAIDSFSKGFSLQMNCGKRAEAQIPHPARSVLGQRVYKRRKVNIKHLKSRNWISQLLLNTKLQRPSFPNKIGQGREEPETFGSIFLVQESPVSSFLCCCFTSWISDTLQCLRLTLTPSAS